MSPRIGIAMAVYRPHVATFVEQLASIAAQDHRNWFCVLTLDSPFRDLQAAAELAPYLADGRFSFRENERRLGFKNNFTAAIAEVVARGAGAVACADQDDIWYPNKLSTLWRALEGHRLALVHADMDVLGADGLVQGSVWERELRHVDRVEPARLLVRNVVTGASLLMDAELARRYPRVPTGGIFHDHWYAFVASLCGGVYSVPERLHAYRQHASNVVGVRPYRGLMNGMGIRELLSQREAAVKNFRARRAYVEFALEAGLSVPDTAQRLVGPASGWELFRLALESGDDRALRREALALALGSVLERVEGKPQANSQEECDPK